jgi:hypothetical protein
MLISLSIIMYGLKYKYNIKIFISIIKLIKKCKFWENKFQNFFEKRTFINVQFYIYLVFYKIKK